MTLRREDIGEILRIIDSAGPGEVRIETDAFSLHVVIGEHGVAAPLPAPEAAAAASAPAGAEAEAQRFGILQTITSPMLGTFYRSDAPGTPPFVEVGAVVQADTVVCIIEVMKMMNSVVAGVAGRVVEICAQSGHLVEYGAPLFRVGPA